MSDAASDLNPRILMDLSMAHTTPPVQASMPHEVLLPPANDVHIALYTA